MRTKMLQGCGNLTVWLWKSFGNIVEGFCANPSKGENCKTKTRPGILLPKKARNCCTRQLHRIVLVKSF